MLLPNVDRHEVPGRVHHDHQLLLDRVVLEAQGEASISRSEQIFSILSFNFFFMESVLVAKAFLTKQF